MDHNKLAKLLEGTTTNYVPSPDMAFSLRDIRYLWQGKQFGLKDLKEEGYQVDRAMSELAVKALRWEPVLLGAIARGEQDCYPHLSRFVEDSGSMIIADLALTFLKQRGEVEQVGKKAQYQVTFKGLARLARDANR